MAVRFGLESSRNEPGQTGKGMAMRQEKINWMIATTVVATVLILKAILEFGYGVRIHDSILGNVYHHITGAF